MSSDAMLYVLFLVAGVAAVFIDGMFIRRSGSTCLAEVYSNPKVAESANRLVTVFFHLVMLGIFALIAVVPNGVGVENLIARFGAMLLLMAVAHGVASWIFARLRGRQQERQLQEEITVRTEERFDDSGLPSVPRPPQQSGL